MTTEVKQFELKFWQCYANAGAGDARRRHDLTSTAALCLQHNNRVLEDSLPWAVLINLVLKKRCCTKNNELEIAENFKLF